MASQIVGEGSCYESSLYVRGYHVYQTVWTPAIVEMPRLGVQTTNFHNRHAVAVIQDGWDGTVHVHRNVSRVIYFLLKEDGIIGYCEVTGERTNRGASTSYYKFYGREP